MAYNKELELNGVNIQIRISNTIINRTTKTEYLHEVCGTKRQYKNYCSTCDKIIPKEEIKTVKNTEVEVAELNANKRLITAKPIAIDQYYNDYIPRAYATYEILGKTDSDNLQLAVMTEYLSANSMVLPLIPFTMIKGIERQAYVYTEQGRLFLSVLRRPSEMIELTIPFDRQTNKEMIEAITTFFNTDLIKWENSDIYTENNLVATPKPRGREQLVNPLLAKLKQIQTPTQNEGVKNVVKHNLV